MAEVVEVRSGHVFILKKPNKEEIEVNLTHVRCKKIGNIGDEKSKSEPFGFEAQEYMRKKYIGKNLKCIINFESQVPLRGLEEGKFLTIQNATLYEGDKIISFDLVQKGYALVYPPREEYEQTEYFADLKQIYDEVVKSGKGVHGKVLPKVPSYWDYTIPKNKKGVKEQFNLGMDTTLHGVITKVYSATRLKLRIDSRNCFVSVHLNGLSGVEPDPNQPELDAFAHQSIDFVRQRLVQRDVEIEVENIDNFGNFHSSIYFEKKLFNKELVERGYAKIEVKGKGEPKHLAAYQKAESEAKKANKGLWKHVVQPLATESSSKFDTTPYLATISEIVSP